ncbi:hypothetical protein MC885_009117 [Smutsia gigantea]|nr:hypothetical protein MC885_009117 [Smutsia gigantea]
MILTVRGYMRPKSLAEESPELIAEAVSEVPEKLGQEAMQGTVNGLLAAGDETPTEPQTNAEGLTEMKDGSGLEEEENRLSTEKSEAAGDGVDTEAAQGATVQSPEDKVKIAANEEAQKREEQMKEGEDTEGSEEEDKENDKAEETPNDSVL